MTPTPEEKFETLLSSLPNPAHQSRMRGRLKRKLYFKAYGPTVMSSLGGLVLIGGALGVFAVQGQWNIGTQRDGSPKVSPEPASMEMRMQSTESMPMDMMQRDGSLRHGEESMQMELSLPSDLSIQTKQSSTTSGTVKETGTGTSSFTVSGTGIEVTGDEQKSDDGDDIGKDDDRPRAGNSHK